MKQHTAGPWHWQKYGDSKPFLGTLDRRRLVVMDFVRLMQAAEPRFATWQGDERRPMDGLMLQASEMNLAIHPDACVIEAAADLLEALQGLGVHPEYGYCFCLTGKQRAAGHTGECRAARAALARALPEWTP